jgi:ribosome-associated translation inhibitor RaiA
MLITISFHDAQGTPGLRRYAQALSQQLAKVFKQVLSVEWHLSTERHLCLVRLQVHARSGFYRATGEGKAFRAALDQAAEKLMDQRRRRKDIARGARRKASAAVRGKLPAAG